LVRGCYELNQKSCAASTVKLRGTAIMTTADKPPVDGGAKTNSPQQTQSNRLTAIGHAVWLMSRSPVHKHLMITDLEWLVTPPIMLSQFRLWQKDGNPVGFASWAYLGEEAEERIVTKSIRRLMPTDWKSGENLWLIDFLSPFGGQEEMLKELREKTHPGQKMKMIQAAPGGGKGVVEW
jgi:cytolysin-activating lysine-acyltransferase